MFYLQWFVGAGGGGGSDCSYYRGGRTALERGMVARGTGAVNRRRATVAGGRVNLGGAGVKAAQPSPLSQRQQPATVTGHRAAGPHGHRRHHSARHDNGGRERFQGVEAQTPATRRNVVVVDPVPGGRGRQAAVAGGAARQAQTVRSQEKCPRRRRFGGGDAATGGAPVTGQCRDRRRHRCTRTGCGAAAGVRRRPATRTGTEARYAAQVGARNRGFNNLLSLLLYINQLSDLLGGLTSIFESHFVFV